MSVVEWYRRAPWPRGMATINSLRLPTAKFTRRCSNNGGSLSSRHFS
jgi:hypothetical protein